MTTESSTFDKVGKPILVLLAIALIIWLAWISMPVLLPFLVGILLAYLLMPLVYWLEKVLPFKKMSVKSRRAIAVALVFIVFTIFLILFIALIGAAIISACSALIQKLPDFIAQGLSHGKELLKYVQTIVAKDVIDSIESALASAAPAVGKFVQDFVVGSVAVIPSSVPTIMGFITLPFFLIFVLGDYEVYGKYFNQILPANYARHTSKILTIFGNQLGRYIRQQIILSAAAGFLVFIGLFLLKVDFSLALGAVVAITQFIPIVGPFISAAILLIVTLALKPELIWWVIGVIVIAQVIVNLFAGWVQEKHFPLNPAVVMILLTVGGYIASYWGTILALPVGATIWGIYKYFREEKQLEQITS